jgi:hypothetical protein
MGSSRSGRGFALLRIFELLPLRVKNGQGINVFGLFRLDGKGFFQGFFRFRIPLQLLQQKPEVVVYPGTLGGPAPPETGHRFDVPGDGWQIANNN